MVTDESEAPLPSWGMALFLCGAILVDFAFLVSQAGSLIDYTIAFGDGSPEMVLVRLGDRVGSDVVVVALCLLAGLSLSALAVTMTEAVGLWAAPRALVVLAALGQAAFVLLQAQSLAPEQRGGVVGPFITILAVECAVWLTHPRPPN